EAAGALALTPDASQVVVAAGKGVRLARLSDGQTTRDLTGATGNLRCVATAGPGLVAAGSDAREVLVWAAQGGQLQPSPALRVLAHDAAVTGVAFNPGGNALASAGKDGVVKLWALPAASPRVLPHPDAVRAAVTDGKQVVTAGADKVVRIWALANPKAP